MATRLDHNLLLLENGSTQQVACAHCGHVIAERGENFYDRLARYEGPATEAGPQIWPEVGTYIDKPVIFRQFYCPSCYTAVLSQVVPADHPVIMDKVI